MKDGILLTIALPYDVIYREKAGKVLLPAAVADVLILEERAPSVFLLRDGVLRLFSADDKEIGAFFVKGGVADVAADQCAVSTEAAIAIKDITEEAAAKQAEDAEREDDKRFYQMIAGYLTHR